MNNDDNPGRRAEDQHTKDVIKEAIKEAITAWLDSQFLRFGRWTAWGVGSLLLAIFVYTVIHLPGFRQAIGIQN